MKRMMTIKKIHKNTESYGNMKGGGSDMHPKSWTAFGGAYFYVKEKEIQHKILARV